MTPTEYAARLRELVAAASPGPWTVHRVPARTARLHDADDRYIANFAPTGSWKRRGHNAVAAAAGSAALLTLASAIEALAAAHDAMDKLNGDTGTKSRPCSFCRADLPYSGEVGIEHQLSCPLLNIRAALANLPPLPEEGGA